MHWLGWVVLGGMTVCGLFVCVLFIIFWLEERRKKK